MSGKYKTIANPKSALSKRMAQDGYITLTQASELAKVHRTTVHRWVHNGWLDHKNLGGAVYVLKTAVEDIVAKRSWNK